MTEPSRSSCFFSHLLQGVLHCGHPPVVHRLCHASSFRGEVPYNRSSWDSRTHRKRYAMSTLNAPATKTAQAQAGLHGASTRHCESQVLQAPTQFGSLLLIAWIMAGDEARNVSFVYPAFQIWFGLVSVEKPICSTHRQNSCTKPGTLSRLSSGIAMDARQRSCKFTFLQHLKLKLGRRLVQVLE